MKQDIVVDVDVKGLPAIEKLKRAFSDVGKSSAKAAKQIDSAKSSIKKTTREAKKAGPDLEDMASKFRAMGSSGTAAGDSLERLSVVMGSKLGMVIGGVTIGLEAIGGAVKLASLSFNALSESISRTIERKRELADWNREARAVVETADRLAKAKEGLGLALDDFAFSATGGQKSLEALAIATETLTAVNKEVYNALEPVMGSLLRVASNAVLLVDGVDDIGKAMAAAVDPTKSLEEQSRALWTGLSMVLDIVGDTSPVYSMGGAFDSLASSAFNAADGIAGAARELAAGFTGRVSGFLGAVAAPFVGAAKKKKTGGGGGGGGRGLRIKYKMKPQWMDAEAQEKLKQSQLEVQANMFAREQEIKGLEHEVLSEIDRKDAMPIGDWQALIAEVDRAMSKLDDFDVTAKATAFVLDNIVASALDGVAEGMLQIGEASLQAMGSFMVGVGTLSEFGDMISDMFGNLSATIGSFFIRTGIGMTLINPATGAGLITAGVMLQVLSGVLSGVGSGNRGVGGSAPASSSEAVTREIQRSLRGPSAGGPTHQTIEIVIAGRAIEPQLVTIIDDITRLNRSRQFSRRGV